MTIFEQLNTEAVNALKEHDTVKRETFTSLIGSIKKLAIDERVTEFSDEFVQKAINKEHKILAEQVATCPEDRTDLLSVYQTKLLYVEAYMPKLMSKEEVTAFVKRNVSEEALASKNVGLIMKTIMPLLKGKADGKVINEVAKEVLK